MESEEGYSHVNLSMPAFGQLVEREQIKCATGETDDNIYYFQTPKTKLKDSYEVIECSGGSFQLENSQMTFLPQKLLSGTPRSSLNMSFGKNMAMGGTSKDSEEDIYAHIIP